MEQILVPIRLKDDKLREQLCLINPRLRAIVLDLAYWVWREYGKELVITSLLRDQEGSVHKYGRGADVRSHNFTSIQIAGMVSHVNENFPYHPKHLKSVKRAALYHNVGQGAHIHIQVTA
ncbi:MAG: hypothetical protein KAJ10_05355 [Thermodesulfovibrionia bacterium]|nr:hypothetical protein [Thermodesulfovibrionia bacterium]